MHVHLLFHLICTVCVDIPANTKKEDTDTSLKNEQTNGEGGPLNKTKHSRVTP